MLSLVEHEKSFITSGPAGWLVTVAFAAHIHKVWMKMETQTRIKNSSSARYVSMGIKCVYAIIPKISCPGPYGQ